jgi:glycine/D-amino acid oxidase-like deaminating enzyme
MGQARWAGTGTTRKSPVLARHEGDSAWGWPGLMIGPGLGRDLGAVARHGPDTILDQPDSSSIVNITFSYK